MIVSINQSSYLPWLGAFDRIQKSDLAIVLDHVPMSKDAVTNRNKIRTPDGFQLLSVPIKNRGGNVPIFDIEIADDRHWKHKHLKALQTNYARAPYYRRHINFFEEIYNREWHCLADLNDAITEYILDQWRIKTTMVKSSSMEARGTKSDLNLNLCLEAGATTYLSGPFGRDYLDVAKFNLHGVEVVFQDYAHPVYNQCWPGEFVPYMSAVDALFNCERMP